MKKKPYEVATVEIEYNGDGETFNHFLSSVVREYVDAEPSAPEEIAYINGFIDRNQLKEIAEPYGKSLYGEHLKAVGEGKIRY